MADRTADGRPNRMLTIVDEYTRECLAIDVAKRLTSEDVLERLSDLFVRRGVPEHIRSDNGSEFTAKCVREWLGRVGVPYWGAGQLFPGSGAAAADRPRRDAIQHASPAADPPYAIRSRITWPPTSVSRKLRPLWR